MRLKKKRWCVEMLSVGMLFATIVYGNDNCLTKDNIETSEIVSVERIGNDKFLNEVNSIQKVTSDKLKDLSQFADIQIAEYEDNRVEYSFIPKRPERIEIYNNGEQLSEYEMVKLTAVPSNQNAESGDRVNSKGKTIKPGKEKTSVKTIASPKIGKTYKLVTGFKYYYSLSTVGNIHGSVTYQLSHNGKTYYKVSNVFNKGNFRA